MAYCSVTDVKSYLGISSATDDVLITSLITQGQAIIDAHVDRTFEAASDNTRNFDSVADTEDGRWLYVDEDLAAITSITNGNGTSITSSDYVTEPRNDTPYYAIKLLSSSDEVWEEDSTTGDSEDAIAIIGKWGYSVAAPEDIKHACVYLASWLYRQKDNVTDNSRPMITGDGVTIMPSQLPVQVTSILRRYKKLVG